MDFFRQKQGVLVRKARDLLRKVLEGGPEEKVWIGGFGNKRKEEVWEIFIRRV
jgi:hypothetical protein